MQKQTFSAKALGNEYATGVSRPAVLTTKAFLPHQRVTTEGKGMIDDIKRIDSMINALRNMKQDIKRQQKLSEINSLDLSPKQAQKRNADADWIAMEQIKRRHELHALSVELGFAERRESYAPFELTDGWHRFDHKPREPQ